MVDLAAFNSDTLIERTATIYPVHVNYEEENMQL